jgi:hypothetical protein
MRREWCARSKLHLDAHERAYFVTVECALDSPDDSLGADDWIEIGDDAQDADVAAGLIERAPRFTRVTFLGVASRDALDETDGEPRFLRRDFGEPAEPAEPPRFELRAPCDLEYLARLDLSVEAKLTATGAPSDLACLRLYLRVLCFHDDDERYALVRSEASASMREHLDQLREQCRSSNLTLGPEFSRLRDELATQIE